MVAFINRSREIRGLVEGKARLKLADSTRRARFLVFLELRGVRRSVARSRCEVVVNEWGLAVDDDFAAAASGRRAEIPIQRVTTKCRIQS
jgi:hypothetical protein